MNGAREHFERLFTEQVKRPGAAELLEWFGKSDLTHLADMMAAHMDDLQADN